MLFDLGAEKIGDIAQNLCHWLHLFHGLLHGQQLRIVIFTLLKEKIKGVVAFAFKRRTKCYCFSCEDRCIPGL